MGLVFRSHYQRGQCSGLRSSGMWRSVCWWLLIGVSAQRIGPILKGQAAQKEFLFDFVRPAMNEWSRSNRRLQAISYDRIITALHCPQTKRTALFKPLRLFLTLSASLWSSYSNCKIYTSRKREDSSTWILNNPSVWIHLTTEVETDTSWRFYLTVVTLQLIITHPDYSTSVTC
jgi:hypothetical protein